MSTRSGAKHRWGPCTLDGILRYTAGIMAQSAAIRVQSAGIPTHSIGILVSSFAGTVANTL